VERTIGHLLRLAVVVFLGGLSYLIHHGAETADHHVFQGEPLELRSVGGIVEAAVALHDRGLIQFGLLLLIATPIARVVFSFARQRDDIYVLITLLILAVPIFSLQSGAMEGGLLRPLPNPCGDCPRASL